MIGQLYGLGGSLYFRWLYQINKTVMIKIIHKVGLVIALVSASITVIFLSLISASVYSKGGGN